ncbi:MAG: L,D-transpeptidase [Candidatus Aenigmarchaeota archaeon]|nr:L,D-transpeptidase [Candidatus Aenigmarchaeota archaeon]
MAVYSILIQKSDFSLSLLEEGIVVRKYTVAIGQRADGKSRIYEEDLRTPEGVFSVKTTHILDNGLWF